MPYTPSDSSLKSTRTAHERDARRSAAEEMNNFGERKTEALARLDQSAAPRATNPRRSHWGETTIALLFGISTFSFRSSPTNYLVGGEFRARSVRRFVAISPVENKSRGW